MSLDFQNLRIEDRETVDPYLQSDGAVMSDRCFASLYMWSVKYKVKWCEKDGFLFLCSDTDPETLHYYMPLGNGDFKTALFQIVEHARVVGKKFTVFLITEERLKEFENCEFAEFEIKEDRDNFDYVYSRETLSYLRGKKLHSKRNFANRFKSLYNWQYNEFDPTKDREAVFDFLAKWHRKSHEDNYDYSFEAAAITRAVKHYRSLGMRGAFLTVDGNIAAFTLAAPQNEKVIDVLIEKADTDFIGSYQTINQQFAENGCKEFDYINREEDLGIEGLRRAKLSYCPEFLSKKYVAFCKD